MAIAVLRNDMVLPLVAESRIPSFLSLCRTSGPGFESPKVGPGFPVKPAAAPHLDRQRLTVGPHCSPLLNSPRSGGEFHVNDAPRSLERDLQEQAVGEVQRAVAKAYGVPGISYLTQVFQAIDSCRAVVLIASATSVRAQVIKEVEAAHERDKMLIAVRIGMSHQELTAANPILRMAIGTSVTLPLDQKNVAGTAQRIASASRLAGRTDKR